MNVDFFDWAKRKTVVALFSSAFLRPLLVLKGGNLLDIAFDITTRSSLDLDFSIEGEFSDIEQMRVECATVLGRAFEDEGYLAIDVTIEELPPHVSDDLKDFWGGYRIGFKLVEETIFAQFQDDLETLRRNAIPLGARGSTVLRIDISKFEYCADKQPFKLDGQDIFGYSPEMVIAEKLRAVCQQMPEYRALVHKHLAGRARDFVDIHAIRESYLVNFDRDEFRSLVGKVFAAKRVPLQLLSRISAHRDDHRADFVAVEATVAGGTELADFDFYVDYVVRECACLESLWDV